MLSEADEAKKLIRSRLSAFESMSWENLDRYGERVDDVSTQAVVDFESRARRIGTWRNGSPASAAP